jgi:bifunctional non-homologous end joining protein LigD
LNMGTKTVVPLDLVGAQKIYEKVLAEKLGKGYQYMIGSGEVAEVKTVVSSVVVDPAIFIPQLLNPVDESEVEGYLLDDAWGMEEKKDGEHQAVHRKRSWVGMLRPWRRV